jgi:mannose-1-phosphate guanylyltransferase
VGQLELTKDARSSGELEHRGKAVLMENLYALIMAGGGGTRLWPLSRKNRPKQMLPLVEDRTMFQVSVERLSPLLPPERIFIVTGRDHVDELRRSAPQVPAENFIVEPFMRNNGPAVGLATAHIQRRVPDAVVAVLTADHHIADKAAFRRVLAASGELALRNCIVTLGIQPTFPATGYGYIQRGESLAQIDGFQAYCAERFTEKPDLATALTLMSDGLHSWNSGMFIYKADRILEEYARQQPEMYALLQDISSAIGHSDYQEVLDRAWSQMPKLSIDYAIMEGARDMAVIPVDMGWSDVGSWATLCEVLESDQNGNIQRGNGHSHITVDTKNTLIISKRRVVTIGLEDTVIVDSGDVVLVCCRDHSQEVRAVVEQLKAAGEEDFL